VTLIVTALLLGCIVGLRLGCWLATRPVTDETVWDDLGRLGDADRKRIWAQLGSRLDARDGYVGEPPKEL
jgi:3'-phosphoadenosine 5'-phosphosulfate sulfotransferase (PAPS reductase)/FAD synthetase